MRLHRNTIQPTTWDLLTGLMAIPELDAFALVGGTNLSLKLGHRISIDIDLFTNEPFDRNVVYEAIRKRYPQVIKYPQSDVRHIILSMTYFEDAKNKRPTQGIWGDIPGMTLKIKPEKRYLIL